MKVALIFIGAIFAASCNNAASPVGTNNPSKANTAGAGTPQTVIAHGGNDQAPNTAAPGEKPKWTQSGEPIDTKELDAAIASAEKALAAKPSDDKLKKAVAEAYYKRGVALTDARQYASALGDYRKAFKNDPSKTEAKDWIDQIIKIYDGLNKSYPKEGEEPPPLPFTKDK